MLVTHGDSPKSWGKLNHHGANRGLAKVNMIHSALVSALYAPLAFSMIQPDALISEPMLSTFPGLST
jgi:hypothetical protein